MDSKKNRIGNISNLLSDKLHTENMDRWLDFRTLGSPSGFSTVDFWEWYASYSIDSSVRGALAEFLVMKALGIEQRRSHWGKCDLVSGSFSFEIKSSAKITCKHPESGAISENKRIVLILQIDTIILPEILGVKRNDVRTCTFSAFSVIFQ